jgi:predicted ATP-dependent endonuclease of OLD family
MAINRIEIKELLVFKGEFAADFCSGINVLIGGNGTGKTTLLRAMNGIRSKTSGEKYFELKSGLTEIRVYDDSEKRNFVYFPEKDILEHAKGLLTFIEEKQTGFSLEYKEILVKAQDVPTNQQSEIQQNIRNIIADKIGGEVEYDMKGGEFYTLRSDGTRIPFANEASGYKKLGLLGLLVKCGQLKDGSVLFWDEPENSLNPELMPVLVDILFELQRSGVQIFLATHSYTLARYFDVKSNDNENNEVMFYNLTKENDGRITAAASPECRTLSKNILDEADEELYKAVVSNAMGVQNGG